MSLIHSEPHVLNHTNQPLLPDDMFSSPAAAAAHFYSSCDAQCHAAAASSPGKISGGGGGGGGGGGVGVGEASDGLKHRTSFLSDGLWLLTESMVHWAMKEAICSPPGVGGLEVWRSVEEKERKRNPSERVVSSDQIIKKNTHCSRTPEDELSKLTQQ